MISTDDECWLLAFHQLNFCDRIYFYFCLLTMYEQTRQVMRNVTVQDESVYWTWLYKTRALECMIQCIVFAVGPLPLTSFSCPPHVHLMSLTWWMRQGLPRFSHSSAPVYYTESKPKNKKRGRPGNEASTNLDNTVRTSVLLWFNLRRQ